MVYGVRELLQHTGLGKYIVGVSKGTLSLSTKIRVDLRCRLHWLRTAIARRMSCLEF